MTFSRSCAAIILAFLLTSCNRSPSHYFDRAAKLFSSGDYAAAVINYRKAIQANGSYGDAYAGLGLTELKLGNALEAYRALSRAVDLLPARDDLKIVLADLILASYIRDKRRPRALYEQLTKLSDQLMARPSTSYDGLRFKAYLAASDNKPEKAIELFEKANAAKPDQPPLIAAWAQILFQTNRFAEGEKLALDLIRKDKSYGPVYDLLYRQYVTARRLDDAEKLLQVKTANKPGDAQPVLQLAAFYANAGRREQMTATLRNLLDDPKRFPEGRIQVGDFYTALQDWEEAIRQYEDGAKSHPKERPAYLKRIANVYLAQGKGEQAAAVVEQILKAQPNNDEVRAVKASVLLKSGAPEKIDRALADFQDLVKRDPNNPVWHFNLGQAYVVKGNSDAGRAEFQGAIQKRKDYVPPRLALAGISLAKHDYKSTIRYADEVLALRPNLAPAILLRSAGLMGARDYAEARTGLERLEKALPRYREAQLQLGSLELTEKQFDKAKLRFQRLYEQDPGDARALTGLVQTYEIQGQFDRAFGFLSGESKKPSRSEAVQVLLAGVAVRLSRYDVAIDEYRQLLQRNPASAELHLRLGSVYKTKGDLPNAIRNLEEATKLAPRETAAAALLADSLTASGRKQEAIGYYRRVLQAQPENASILNNLAFLIADTGGNIDEALLLAQRAAKIAPQQPNLADTLGWIYLKKGQVDAALQVFRNDAQKYPDNATFRYHLGLALLQAGDKAKAKTELQAALAKKPSPEVSNGIQQALTAVQKPN